MVTAYVGYDCTADSLHVGNLVSIMMLRHLQRAGHRPIALVGGGTTKVGDPSGKDESRQLLTQEQIDANKRGIEASLAKFLDFGAGGAVLVDNDEWLGQLGYIPFLRDFGTHFTINRMLTFDSVKLRLEREQPLTLLEFNYMVMQAYDFLELSRRHGCRLQMGGSDQWGNIVNGVELGRRIDGSHLFGLTTPLITTAAGQKMGKTAAGAVWLNADRRTPVRVLAVLAQHRGRRCRPLPAAVHRAAAGRDRPARAAWTGAERNEAKKVLAFEATRLCHGVDAAEQAAAAARAVFEGGGEGVEGLPVVTCDAARLRAGLPVIELLFVAGLAGSNSEARRLVRGGGARAQRRARSTTRPRPSISRRVRDGHIKLSAGRKRHVLVRPA